MATPHAAANLEIIDDKKNTRLHTLAVLGNHKCIMEYKAGKKIDAQNSWGITPLMFAARRGHFEAVQALLDLRADATKLNQYNGSVFLMAIASGCLDVVNLLLKHLLTGGVSRQAMESYLSPIAISILFNHEHVFKYLLGAKFNVRSMSMFTEISPLMFAALSENPLYSEHLMANGADPLVRNINGETSQDLEIRKNGIFARTQQETLVQIPTSAQPAALPPAPSVVIVSPQQQFYNQLSLARKSSNIETPEVITPAISPVGYYPQVFFPPDFTPTQFASPTYYVGCAAFSPFRQDYIVSPFFGIPTPFSNLHSMNIADVNGLNIR